MTLVHYLLCDVTTNITVQAGYSTHLQLTSGVIRTAHQSLQSYLSLWRQNVRHDLTTSTITYLVSSTIDGSVWGQIVCVPILPI